MKLNLETKNKEQELIKAYLEETASETLAEKINNGVPAEKDGKRLINRKTLDGFMKYACDEARKQAEKGTNSACIQDSVVFGWAVHYFEEDGIQGTLYSEDGTEYKPEVLVKAKSPKPAAPSKPQPKPQMSLFDFVQEQPQAEEEPQPEQFDDEDEPPSEEEQREILAELAEEEERQNREQELSQDCQPAICETSGISNIQGNMIDETTGEILSSESPSEPDMTDAFNRDVLLTLFDLLGECFILR